MIFTAEYRCLEFEPLLFFRPALGGGESRSRGVAVGMDAVGDADFRFGMLYSGDFARYSNAPGVFDFASSVDPQAPGFELAQVVGV